jgi:hypothetical protein
MQVKNLKFNACGKAFKTQPIEGKGLEGDCDIYVNNREKV